MTEDNSAAKDRRQFPFYQIDNAVLDDYVPGDSGIGVHGLAVYNVLARIAGAKGHAWPAMQTIADRLNISRRQVLREIAKLEGAGLVEATARYDDNKQQSNLYLLSHVGPKPAAPTPKANAQPLGTLWERTYGRVAAAADHQAKLRELFALWREAFADSISPTQMQQLVNEAGSPEALAKAIAKAAVSVEPPIANPFGLVRRGLGFKPQQRQPTQQQKTSPQPREEFTPSGRQRYDLEW